MHLFDKSQWIWTDNTAKLDEYGEFVSEFEFDGSKTKIYISADSNYALYLNGELAGFGQYADFPYDKVYDEIDLTDRCKQGKNRLAIVVWYYGIDSTQVYYPGNAALRFEVVSEDKLLAYSSTATKSRTSLTYRNHGEKIITVQLGYSYDYDITKEDGWFYHDVPGFSESRVVEQDLPLRPRPCEKLVLRAPSEAKLIKSLTPCDLLFDIGINTVGFLFVEAESDEPQKLTISYGEHIVDGRVRRLVGGRDFSVNVTVGRGVSEYTNPFRRLGAKYLEVHSDSPVKIKRIGLIPTEYPLTVLPRPKLTARENEIYDICERTLRLCMHEHYEDCPWREQALYCMDSRNQMLFGYYAFGEYRFPRACLELMSKDDRADGLLSICYPIRKDLAIPSFSLHYFTQCAEYLKYSSDVEFLRSIYPKLCSVLDVFLDRGARDGKLIKAFYGSEYWNFYEWTNALDGGPVWRIFKDPANPPSPDLPIFGIDVVLNSLLVLALENMAYIADSIGEKHSYNEIANSLRKDMLASFYDKEKGVFADRTDFSTHSVLGNSLAILAGVVDGELAENIAATMVHDNDLTPISLSMRCFFYDALLKLDASAYSEYILNDIERIYRPMVELGVGTVWETELGEKDFQNAGSLCHGWSALPIYYYHILKA